MPGSFRTRGQANQVNSWGHMMFLKNKILIHSHSPLFTQGVCFFFFPSWAISGLTGLWGEQSGGPRASWEGEGPVGQGRAPPPSHKARKGPGLGLYWLFWGKFLPFFWATVQPLDPSGSPFSK